MTRRIQVVRGAWGMVLLGVPGRVSPLITGQPADRLTTVVARVLGARHVTQAVLLTGLPTPTTYRLGVVADVLHSLSAVGLAVVSPTYRRAGIVEAGLAGSFAVAGVVRLRRTVRGCDDRGPATAP